MWHSCCLTGRLRQEGGRTFLPLQAYCGHLYTMSTSTSGREEVTGPAGCVASSMVNSLSPLLFSSHSLLSSPCPLRLSLSLSLSLSYTPFHSFSSFFALSITQSSPLPSSLSLSLSLSKVSQLLHVTKEIRLTEIKCNLKRRVSRDHRQLPLFLFIWTVVPWQLCLTASLLTTWGTVLLHYCSVMMNAYFSPVESFLDDRDLAHNPPYNWMCIFTTFLKLLLQMVCCLMTR